MQKITIECISSGTNKRDHESRSSVMCTGSAFGKLSKQAETNVRDVLEVHS
jgi:hypothetical protein